MIRSAMFAVQRYGLIWLLLAAIPATAQVSNGVYREAYLNIGGSTIPDLTNNPAFPNSPGVDEVITNLFEGPVNWAENYGQRMRALITPPMSGAYTFWVASDDQGELWLSTDATPVNRRRIASVASWTNPREWTKETNQMSAPITLAAGQQYYIEALQKEGGGGDHLAVRWQLPNGSWENPSDPNQPIPASRLTPYGLSLPVFAQQPANVTVVEGGLATFTVRLARNVGAVFQWQRNGTNLVSETASNLTVGPVSLGDSGSVFRCVVRNWLGVTNTTNALLSVIPDTTPPALAAIGNLGDPELLTVVFTEDVEPASATNANNYGITPGINVLGAAFGPDGRTIVLTTTPMVPNVAYTLTVNNVRDRASTPNSIVPNTKRVFAITPAPLPIGYRKPAPEPIGPSTRRGPLVISEVMYHPTNRVDGKNLEFIEVYNTLPWYEELGGYKISGAIDYTFPSNFVLGGRSFVVIAKNPADLQSAYGITGVMGPWSGTLQNGSGSLRLRNAQNAILFDMTYAGDAPFPLAADGAGHSLVLARPSFGERDSRAWAASDLVGGTPGTNEIVGTNPFGSVMINEFFAHSAPPDLDYIELFNYGSAGVNIGGCSLTDDPATNKFVIPTGTIIPANGFAVFYETNLGFALGSAGESIYLRNPARSRVIDCIRFDAQQVGVSMGRYPDGAALFSRLQARTPGTNNSAPRFSPVVINEIMYHPITENDDDTYIELYNASTNAVDVSRWRIEDAVKYTIPANTIIPPNGYAVIARNAGRLRATYPSLNGVICLGDWSGSLSGHGERVALSAPELVVTTNGTVVVTNTHHIVVDEVSYGVGGRWGRWSDGGGSSLELRDPHSDHRLAPNWADSDESARSGWVNVEATGVMINGYSDASQLHITLLGEGECLVDNVEVIPAGGANLVANGTFETGTAGWVFQGNHNGTSWEPAAGYNSGHSLHLRATGRGDTGANRVRVQLSSIPGGGTTITLRAKVRWLKGNPHILLRLRGNWHEAFGDLLTTSAFGTPGVRNSATVPNASPAITDVHHWPALPAAGQAVLVTAQANDPDGLATLLLKYRLDPSTNFSTVAMVNNGAGLFSGTIPAQPTNGAVVAFYLAASDKPGAFSSFPSDAPDRECVVIWGDTANIGTLPTYRFWLSRKNLQAWVAEEKMSNHPKDVTFIYGTNRVVYNAGAWFHGSPYHSPGYDSPIGSSCDYDMNFPEDDLFLGETDINLFRPGNGGGDGTGQAEIHGHWWAKQFGLPFLFHRPVFVVVNGNRRDNIFHDAQQPNGDFAKQWFPSDDGGELHKVQLGFEFGDQAYGASEAGYTAIGASLSRVTTSTGDFSLPRYRQTLPLRSAAVFDENNYTNLFALINAVNTGSSIGTPAYTAVLTNATAVDEWFRVDVLQHLWENTDSFSYGGGQNAFLYKPARSPWQLLLWDIDFAFGGAGTDGNLFGIGGADHGPRNDHAPFRRLYWQALLDGANGILTATRSSPILDARYSGLVSAGANVSSPNGIKTFISNKRTVVLSQLATVGSPFTITSSTNFSSVSNLVTISGTAPIDVRTIEVNGIVATPTWSTITNWSITIPLASVSNYLAIVGRDSSGNIFSNATATVIANVTGSVAAPQDSIAFNEIMYSPKVPGAEYVELFNRSASTSFDVSRWRIDGLDYTFPDNTIFAPRRYIILAKDPVTFAAVYGTNPPVFAQYDGNLQGGGETLTLIKPGLTPAADVVVDRMRYDNSLPWPVAADGTGSSLQLVDAAQDHARVANWQAKYIAGTVIPAISTPAHTNDGWRFVSVTAAFGANNRFVLYLDNAGSVLLDDIALVSGSTAGAGFNYIQNGGFESPLDTNVWVLGTNMAATRIIQDNTHSGSGALSLVQDSPGAPGVLTRDLLQTIAPSPTNGQLCTLSFWYWATNNTASNLFVRIVSSSFNFSTNISVFFVPSNYVPGQVFGETNYATPGSVNSFATNLAAFPPLWINELQAENLSGPLDSAGQHDPWIELYNAGTNSASLNGLFLSDNYTNLTLWAFPPGLTVGPKQFATLFVDGETDQTTNGEIHAGFRLAARNGKLALSRISNGSTQVLDYVNYTVGLDHSFGSYPDGQPFTRQEFYYVTPGATNNGTLPPVTVWINEWMADNLSTLTDPADGDFEDWFEIYNPGTNTVSLAGYYLTDTLTNKFKYQIPGGYSIPPHGYLLVWADGETGQNSASRPDLHVDFNLAKTGEAIGLFTPAGLQIDAVIFGAQNSDISMGRFPDGGSSIYLMTNATPRSTNFYPLPNTRPVVAAIAGQTIIEGSLFGFTPSVTDTDYPPQQVTWSLASAPAAATIDPVSGAIVWATKEADGGSAFEFSVFATDNGAPPLSATQTFMVTVLKTNSAPLLAAITNVSVEAGATLAFNVEATDTDYPAQMLSFSLDPGSPAGASIDPGLGAFTWTPTGAQAPGVYSITIRVRDDGTPPMSDSATFTVTVNAATNDAALRIDPITLTNGAVRLSWPSVPGRAYRVEYNTNLSAGAWLPLSTNIAADAVTAITDAIETNGQRLYRIVAP